jgi:uncharacterized membrane protein (UPF0127 family)
MNFKTRAVLVLFAFAFLCCSAAACGPKKLAAKEFPTERDGLKIAVIKAEIARTQEERGKGLMYRKKLPDGKGMLFIFDKDAVQSFWMKNTYIPLSIAFIVYDGRIIEIKDMQPGSLNSVISSRSVRYALETPQGWFSRAGVRNGDVVKIELAE